MFSHLLFHLFVVRTPLHAAAYSGNVAGLQLVTDQGAEVNSVDERGCSALMVAAERGQTGATGVREKRRKADVHVSIESHSVL